MIAIADVIIARLKTQFSEVEGLIALGDLQDKNLPRQKLFVLDLQERVGPLVEGMGLYRHTIATTIGVLLIVPARNNAQPDVMVQRNQIRALLYGWEPHQAYTPLYLSGGQLQPSRPGTVAWLDKFTTEYTEDALGV